MEKTNETQLNPPTVEAVVRLMIEIGERILPMLSGDNAVFCERKIAECRFSLDTAKQKRLSAFAAECRRNAGLGDSKPNTVLNRNGN